MARRSPPRPRGHPRASRAAAVAGTGRLRLREATLKDLSTLVRHRRGMWRELRSFPPRELDRHDVAYRRWVRTLMPAGEFVAFLVEDGGGAPVGSGGLWLMPSQPRPGVLGRGRVPYILSMFTEPAFRGRGVASRIVRAMLAWSRRQGYGRVVLHASRFGRPVYERLGFEPGSEMRLELIRRPAGRR